MLTRERGAVGMANEKRGACVSAWGWLRGRGRCGGVCGRSLVKYCCGQDAWLRCDGFVIQGEGSITIALDLVGDRCKGFNRSSSDHSRRNFQKWEMKNVSLHDLPSNFDTPWNFDLEFDICFG